MIDRCLLVLPASFLLSFALGACGSTPNAPDEPAWKTYAPTEGEHDIRAMSIDSAGNLWAGAYDGGISRYDGATWTYYSLFRSTSENAFLTALEVDTKGRVWCGAKGLGVFEGGQWRTFPALANDYITAIAVGADGNVYVAREGAIGIYNEQFDAMTWYPTDVPDAITSSYAMAVDNAGGLWIGHDSLVTRIAANGSTVYGTSEGLTGGTITSLAVDSSGRAWCATTSGLLFMFDGTRWGKQSDLSGGVSVVVVEQGQTWAGTTSGGKVYQYNAGAWKTFELPTNTRGRVQAITIKSDGSAWFATETGIAQSRSLP